MKPVVGSACVAGLLLALFGSSAIAGQRLDDKLHHLRWGATREWDEFPEHPESSELVIRFDSTSNTAERTLRIRHRDLRQAWDVSLNDKKVTTLPRDQPETVTYWAIAPGMLKQGANTLRIACSAKPPVIPPGQPAFTAADDVIIGDIELLNVPRSEALSEGRVEVVAFAEDSDAGYPCRITVTDQRGALVDLGNTSIARQAVRPGVIYTRDGRADLSLAAGRYTIYVGRGFEYNLPTATIDIRPGDKLRQEFRLRRIVPTDGWVACDPHVHTFTFSRHGDATIEERMWTLAGEGIELPIATDHNLNIDYEQVARDTGARSNFRPITGCEVTTKIGHFNVFPTANDGPLPDWRAPTWGKIAESIEKAKVGEQAVVILNHGRDTHLGFRPFDPVRHLSPIGENLDGWNLPTNAMEVINSGATLTDPMQLYRDWFGLMNRGKFLTPIGASDSHDVNRYIVGQARTYVRIPDQNPSQLSVRSAVQAIVEGRVMVSYGLLADLTIDNKFAAGDLAPSGSNIKATVRVLGPDWTRTTSVTLYANGVPIRTAEITQPIGKPEPAGVKFETTWTLPRPRHDVWLTVIARGPGVTGAYWPVSKPYQQTATAWSPYVMGSSGVIRIDADGNGRFDSAFDYASGIVDRTAGDPAKSVAALKELEEPDGATAQATAAQVAGLLRHRFPDRFESDLRAQLNAAGPGTRQGLEQFFAAWKESETARAARDSAKNADPKPR